MLARTSLATAAIAATIGIVVATGVTGGLGCARHPKQTPEQQIRALLDEATAALEAQDAGRAAEALSDGYLDGNKRNKDTMKKLAFFTLQRGRVLVSLQNVQIDVDGDAAKVHLVALALASPPQVMTAKDLLPNNARSFSLDLKVVREDGAWRVTSIDGDGLSMGLD